MQTICRYNVYMRKTKTAKPAVNIEKVVSVTDEAGHPQAVRFNDSTRVHPALKEYLCYCMIKSANRMKTMVDEALLPLQLQTIHFGILSILNRGDIISQIRMGQELGIDKASMVKLINKLEALKLVERIADAKDRRIKLLKLTAQGKSTFAKTKKISADVEVEFLKNLNCSEREVLRKIIPLLLEKK